MPSFGYSRPVYMLLNRTAKIIYRPKVRLSAATYNLRVFELDHLGIAVAALAESVPLYCRLLGLDPAEVEYHEVTAEGVRVAMLRGNVTIELLEPRGPASPIARFLEKRGPGFHHWCFRTPDAGARMLALEAAGFDLIPDTQGAMLRQGAEGKVCFVHPRSTGGILTEFAEPGAGDGIGGE